MKKLNNKGFTIVELVIVIAVIAILAAVLIPTVSGLIKTAQTSADVTLVKNVNMFLATERAAEGKNATMQDALDDALEGGYDVTKLTPTNSDNLILWDQESDNFVLYANGKYNSAGADVKVDTNALYKLWNIADNTEGSDYSVYYTGTETEVAVNGVGFDAGTSSVATVNYVNTTGTAKNVVVRTNGGTLTVDAEQDDVVHYGKADSINIKAVKAASYHEFGKVSGNITISKGNISMEQGSSAAAIIVDLSVVSGDSTAKVSVNTNDVENVPVIVDKTAAEALSNVELNIGTNDFVNTGVDGVAVIKNNGYETLQAAIDAAVDGDVIVLLEDIALGTDEAILVNKTVTLNLNGKTISGSHDPLFVIGANVAKYKDLEEDEYTYKGHLSVCGEGSIISTKWDTFVIFNSAKLDIYGGNFESSHCVVYANGGTFNAFGGNFTTTGTGAGYIVRLNSAASANIYAGNFTSGNDGCYGVYLENASEVNLGSKGESGPTINTWRSCISTNGSASHAVVVNIYSGTYTSNRTGGDVEDQSVIQLANAEAEVQTVNIYGGYFEQTAAPTGSVFNVRYDGTININIGGGEFKCAASRLFTGFGKPSSGCPTEANIRVNVTNDAISTKQVVEMYYDGNRDTTRDFVVVD